MAVKCTSAFTHLLRIPSLVPTSQTPDAFRNVGFEFARGKQVNFQMAAKTAPGIRAVALEELGLYNMQ